MSIDQHDYKSIKSNNGQRFSPKYQRVVIKVGTTLLTDGSKQLAPNVMSKIVEQIAILHSSDVQVLLVTSGAVAAGRHVLGITSEHRNIPLRQIMAAVGQSRLMQEYEKLFDSHNINIAQALLSRRDLKDRLGYLNIRNTILGLTGHKVLPIINENDVVAVEELSGESFGDNDTLSAMVANLVDADLLIILGEIEGLYTKDPNIHSDAALIPIVEHISQNDVTTLGGPSWQSRGQGGMSTKLEAARLAAASGINVVIASGRLDNSIVNLVSGENIGTLFPATNSKLESRKRWMLSGLSNKSQIIIDSGAIHAISNQNGSLLAAGITKIEGSFERGDIVSLFDNTITQVACGITNYDSRELSKIKGHHSHEIAEILGHHYGDEIIHRNNMVLI